MRDYEGVQRFLPGACPTKTAIQGKKFSPQVAEVAVALYYLKCWLLTFSEEELFSNYVLVLLFAMLRAWGSSVLMCCPGTTAEHDAASVSGSHAAGARSQYTHGENDCFAQDDLRRL